MENFMAAKAGIVPTGPFHGVEYPTDGVKDAAQHQTIDLAILDDTLTEMRIHTVNGPETCSYNDIDRTEVGITVSEWMPFTGSVTLAPHSVNVIEMR